MGKTVVMSDMHFGLKNSSLNINSYDNDGTIKLKKHHIDNLFKWFEKEHEDINEFMFIGDIFDLQLQHFQEAISGSHYFFKKLNKLKNLKKIIYIPGNHDHTMWLLHIYYSDIILNFNNNAYPIFNDNFFNLVNNREFRGNDSFLKKIFTDGRDIDFCVTYPLFLHKEMNGKNIVFFHGHFLDKSQRLVQKLLEMALPSMDLSMLQEFELTCSPQYESLFILAQCSSALRSISGKYIRLKKYLDEYRLPVHYHHKNIVDHLRESGLKIRNQPIIQSLDYVIFGHTHDAGVSMYKFKTNPDLIAMNTGSWIMRKKELGEFIMIDRNWQLNTHPQLYVFKKTQSTPILHYQSEDLNEGDRPIKGKTFEKNIRKYFIF